MSPSTSFDLAPPWTAPATGAFCWRVATDDIMGSREAHRIFAFDSGPSVTLDQIRSRLHPQDLPVFNDSIERARRAGVDVECDLRLKMHDQSVKYVHLTAQASRDAEGGWAYLGAIQDVTQCRLMQQALDTAREELIHVARVAVLGALTASIAHEVTQPISGIITNASTCLLMLASHPPDLEGARETALRTIRDGHRAFAVITHLRALFSKESVATDWVDLNETAREVITLSLSELQRRRGVLRTELTDHLPPIRGDRVQLQQVILNLLLNAAEAMHGVEDRARQLVVKSALDDNNRVRFSVHDTGMGLGRDQIERVFEPFYTTKRGGMGIGLSVSRSIIERHGGRLWAEPNDGAGATFAFCIPVESPA